MDSDERPDNFLNSEEVDKARREKEAQTTTEAAPANAATDPDVAADGGRGGETSRQKPRRRGRRVLAWLILLVFIPLGVIAWLRYLNPYVVDAQESGYVYNVERRGVIFKTFEGEMIADRSLRDSSRVYPQHLQFSVPDDSIARLLQEYQNRGTRVTVTYERYSGTLPWRGASVNVVTAVTPD